MVGSFEDVIMCFLEIVCYCSNVNVSLSFCFDSSLKQERECDSELMD